MEKNYTPNRKCIVCGKISDKTSYFRIVKNKDGNILYDKNHKLDGRGAYICKEGDCFQNLIKKNALNRAFKYKVHLEIYERMIREINSNE